MKCVRIQKKHWEHWSSCCVRANDKGNVSTLWKYAIQLPRGLVSVQFDLVTSSCPFCVKSFDVQFSGRCCEFFPISKSEKNWIKKNSNVFKLYMSCSSMGIFDHFLLLIIGKFKLTWIKYTFCGLSLFLNFVEFLVMVIIKNNARKNDRDQNKLHYEQMQCISEGK